MAVYEEKPRLGVNSEQPKPGQALKEILEGWDKGECVAFLQHLERKYRGDFEILREVREYKKLAFPSTKLPPKD